MNTHERQSRGWNPVRAKVFPHAFSFDHAGLNFIRAAQTQRFLPALMQILVIPSNFFCRVVSTQDTRSKLLRRELTSSQESILLYPRPAPRIWFPRFAAPVGHSMLQSDSAVKGSPSMRQSWTLADPDRLSIPYQYTL